jgi:hypothetical protein
VTPCKRAAELISLSLETPLSWRQRLSLALHLSCCNMCRRFRRQMRLLQRAGQRAGQGESMSDLSDVSLPAQARERIKSTLRDKSSGPL